MGAALGLSVSAWPSPARRSGCTTRQHDRSYEGPCRPGRRRRRRQALNHASSVSGRRFRPCGGNLSSCDTARRRDASAPVPSRRRGALAHLQLFDNWIVAANDPARAPRRLPLSRNNRPTSRIPAANTLDRSQLQAVRFRGDFPAASLKPSTPPTLSTFQKIAIPRGLPRGLIEASVNAMSIVGGSLRLIPRGLPRGLIEAAAPADSHRRQLDSDSRGDFPAASLKPAVVNPTSAS